MSYLSFMPPVPHNLPKPLAEVVSEMERLSGELVDRSGFWDGDDSQIDEAFDILKMIHQRIDMLVLNEDATYSTLLPLAQKVDAAALYLHLRQLPPSMVDEPTKLFALTIELADGQEVEIHGIRSFKVGSSN